MKKILFVAAAAAALSATPAMAADFSGPRVEVTAGVDDVTGAVDTTDIAYGTVLGYDLQFGKVVLGAEATAALLVNSSLEKADLGAAARLGVKATDNILVYGRVGYTNIERPQVCTGTRTIVCRNAPNLDGVTVGGGVETKLAESLFGKVEYRYTDFSNSAVGRHGVLVGLGLRF